MTQEQTLELLVKTLTDQNAMLQQQLQHLTAQLAWMNRQMFGRKSEKLSPFDPNQPSLFEPIAPIKVEELVIIPEVEVPSVPKKKPHKSRQGLEDLPIVEETIEPESVDLSRYKRIGEQRTSTLEFTPGKLYVKVLIRPKYGLKDSSALPKEGESAVMIAPLPLAPIHKGMASASLLAEVLLQKYQYHVPFYRQVQQFSHLGFKVSENTLSGWFKPVCGLLRPLYEVLKGEVLSSDYIQVDETTLPVVNKDKHKTDKEYLWMIRSGCNGSLFFHYDNGSRSQRVIKELLNDYQGYLQCDGYKGYNVFEQSSRVCLVGCLAHIRRYFENALNESKTFAEYALKRIQALYKIEHSANEANLSYQERAKLRQKNATHILDELEQWMQDSYSRVYPKSLIGRAIAFAYSLWSRMRVYLKDGRIKIDNNLAENAIRPIALSRKNFLFCGNHESAENTAIICSLLGSCKESDVNPRVWLTDIIAKMPYLQNANQRTKEELQKLLPNRWVQPISRNLETT